MEPSAELTGRCTVVVAAAGYGKSAAVRRWLGQSPAHWHAGVLPVHAGVLPALPGADDDRPQWIVVDDLAGIRGDLSDVLAGLAGAVRLVLVSRWPLTVASRLRRQGLVVELGPADLAFTPAETAAVLNREYGLTDPTRSTVLHQLTGGWPALVHFAGERLTTAAVDVGDLPTVLAGPGTAVATFLDKHVLTPLPPAGARLVREMAWLGPVDEGLCRVLGHRRPERTLALLSKIGLVTAGDRPSARHLVPLLAEVARDRWPLPAGERQRLLGAAGDWYAGNARPAEAVEAYRLADRSTAAARLLRAHGPAWVTAGGAPTIAAAIRSLAPDDRCPALRLLLGEALLVLGEDDAALAELSALATEVTAEPTADAGPPGTAGSLPPRTADTAGAGPAGSLPPGLAWRLGAVHYLRADPRSAMAVFARGRLGAERTADEAMLLAWDSTARWMAADPAASGELARRALAAADRADDDRARAAAHVALAMHAMLSGDRAGNAAHYDAALCRAEAAGDVVQAARIHANRSALLLEEAHYADALAEARRATALAESTGYAAILAVALCNEGDALFRLARLDEAAGCFRRALAVFQRKGSRKVAYPLVGLGAIHRAQGRHSLARAAYEEAARAATTAGDVQGMVPALAGLARLMVDSDPAGAARQAQAARDAASGPFVAEALLATGWVQLGTGDRAAATQTAVDAAAQARRHRDSSRLAEALELRAAAAIDPAEARQALCEAAETWRLTGAQLDLDRVVVAVSELPDATVAERIDARLARERLAAAGVLLPVPPATARADRRPATSRVDIRSLGRFEVSVGDIAVTMSTWQSRKARDLLRILVARRGRAIARDELTELLWPGGDADRLAHRLSVALSTVRTVLDPDRATAPDHFVLADRSAVALEVDNVTVDLEVFLGEAAHGLTLRERGSLPDAYAVLAAAERRYAGDFLEDEPYEDWSVATREDVRATYLRTVRALAELSRDTGRVDDAVHYLLKVLDKDPYDERGHRELVDTLTVAGRHGESRRAQARYLAAMEVIGVPAG